MFKVCAADLLNNENLHSSYESICMSVPHLLSYGVATRKKFFSEWLRKLVHARLGEFISG